MSKGLVLLGAFAVATSVVACGAEDDVVEAKRPTNATSEAPNTRDDMVGVNEDGIPIGKDGEPLVPIMHGKYELGTQFDFTSTGILPNVVNDTLKALSDFRESPSASLFGLLEATKAPVVSNLLAVVPGPLKEFLYDWIDETVFKQLYQNVPVAKQVAGIIDDLASIVTKFEVVTELDLQEGDAIGDGRSSHTITGLAYNWSEKRHVVRAPDVAANLTTQMTDTNYVMLDKLSPELETGRLKIGNHTFSVPIGTFALKAAEWMVTEKLGKPSVRAAIGEVVNCPNVARVLSERCANVGGKDYCVGHANEIKAFCETGLDVLVGVLLGRIKDLDIPVLRLEQGSAEMWDAEKVGGPLDAIVSRLDHGYWTAKVNAKGGEKPILAVFTGHRITASAP